MRTYLLLVLGLSTARAESLQPQVQIDGGLSVIGAGYEHPLRTKIALQGEAFIFGTYFLPWFDLGDDVKGFGIGVRPTWFARETGHGLYVTPFFRGVAVDAEGLFGASGLGFESGVFVGWAFRLSEKLDLRVGGGAQYIHFDIDTAGERRSASTPFVALDATLGWRL